LSVAARSSATIDCLLSSFSSSAISMRRRLRSELVEDDVEPEAVCNEQAADRVESLSSLDEVMGNTVSWGENFSVTALK
jgi:hypothetical protein